jgi:hypothetical protein
MAAPYMNAMGLMAIAGFTFVASCSAECLGDTPVKAARALWRKHPEFFREEAKNLSEITTDRLKAAILKENECARGQVCALDYDPWLAGQHGEVGQPIKFSVISQSRSNAVVQMRYVFRNPPTPLRRVQTDRLQFERFSSHTCWVVSDLIDPKGDSLYRRLAYYYDIPAER